jgi:hypothetical protein
MAQRVVTMTIEADIDKVWPLLSSQSNRDWMPATGRVEVEDGGGPGTCRRIYGKGGQGDKPKLGDIEVDNADDVPVVERLISVDDERHNFVYRIEENNPMPVSSYVVTVDVEEAPAGGTLVRWTVDFETEQEDLVVGAIDGVYTMIGGWLKDATET